MPNRASNVVSRTRLDQRAIDRIATLHERFLNCAKGGQRAFMRYADAPGIDCRQRLLNDADLTGANLSGSNLAGTHFERAALYCVNLEGCDLRSANLKRADLRGARLAGAVLSGAVMDEADMRAAYIAYPTEAGLHVFRHGRNPTSNLAGDDFGADFTNCAMRGVRLCAANLKGANFTGAVLESADFTGARVTDAVFKDTVLHGVNLKGVELSPEQLKGCVFGPNFVARARADTIRDMLQKLEEWVETGGRRGEPAAIDDEDLRPLRGVFRGRVLTALSARRVRAIHMDFSSSTLQGASFNGADLRGAVFDGCDLRGASFRGANLSHARFAGADLTALVLDDGRLHSASFEGATLDGVDFSTSILE